MFPYMDGRTLMAKKRIGFNRLIIQYYLINVNFSQILETFISAQIRILT